MVRYWSCGVTAGRRRSGMDRGIGVDGPLGTAPYVAPSVLRTIYIHIWYLFIYIYYIWIYIYTQYILTMYGSEMFWGLYILEVLFRKPTSIDRGAS